MADETKKKEKKKTKNEMDFPPIKVVIGGNEMDVLGGSKKFRKNLRAAKLEQDLDKQGYKGTPEKQSNSKVNPIDNANRIRGGLKKVEEPVTKLENLLRKWDVLLKVKVQF